MNASHKESFLQGASKPPARARPVGVVWLFVGIVACLLGLTVYSAQLLSAGNAFIASESAWSKAQKDAVFFLTRYAAERADPDYQAFLDAMAVIDGDRLARTELDRPDFDREIVRRGFVAGGVHPQDVDGMIRLYRSLRGFGPVEYLVQSWTRSDGFVRQLQDIGRELHGLGPSEADRTRADQLSGRVQQINRALGPMERDFAETLDEMERAAQSLLSTGILVITGVLLIAGITLSRRLLSQNEKLQEALVESESQLRHLIAAAPMPLLIARASDQRLMYLNDKAAQELGLSPEEAMTRSFAEFHADTKVRSALSEQLSRVGSVADFELHLKGNTGRQSWMLMSAQPLRYAGVVCLLVALANIDDRKRLQEDMRRRALHDPLTQLPNRAMFLEQLERAAHKARRRGTSFSVLFVDLDRFKEVNDTMGHQAGDMLLKSIAERLVSAVRQSDLVARLGGDEFVILIEEHGGPEELMIVAQKVLTLLEQPVSIDWREAAVSGSIGIATFPDDGEEMEGLLKNADTAMYQAKDRGRNNFQFYSPELNVISQRRLELERRVREALDRDELFIEYLAETDLASGSICAIEALVRWRNPEGDVMVASEFVPLAEETGIAAAMGAWVLDHALADAKAWRADGLDATLAVNLSGRQLQQAGLVEQVSAALQAHDIPATALRLEVSEPVLLELSDAAHRTLAALRALGVQIAIDDFGAGFSSLGLVRGLPVQVVKIDPSLVSSCPARRECAAIVEATVAMAHALGIRVVAEGVESPEQCQQMIDLGCDAAQGRHFGEPVEAARLAGLVRAPRRQANFAREAAT